MSKRKLALKPKNSLIDPYNLSTELEVLHVCQSNLWLLLNKSKELPSNSSQERCTETTLETQKNSNGLGSTPIGMSSDNKKNAHH